MDSTTTRDDPKITAPSEHSIAVADRHVCPFCGLISAAQEGICPQCKINAASSTRKSTKALMGPWYVLQAQNPTIPGITFARLIELLKKGRVPHHAVVRGPSTHQFWRFAAQVKGLSREFGVCYQCGAEVACDAANCDECECSQMPPADPDALLEPGDREPAPSAPDVTETETPDWSHDVPVGEVEARHGDILGAREISAAFQLGSHSKSRRRRASSRSMERPPKKRGKRMLIGTILGALALVAVGGTVLFVAPHQPALDRWLQQVGAPFGIGHPS